MTIHDIINEIQQLKKEPTRKSVFEINRLLQNNKVLILETMDKEALQHLMQQFDHLSQASHQESSSENFGYEYEKRYNLLMYYLNKKT